MFISKQHHLLCTSLSSSHDDTKLYTQLIQWYTVQSYDFELLVRHKWELKTIPFKQLWSNMSVLLLLPRPLHQRDTSEKNILLQTLSLYHWFDEQTGESYSFVPSLSQKKYEYVQWQLTRLTWYHIEIKNENNMTKIVSSPPLPPFELSHDLTDEQIASALVWFSIIYGNWEFKNNKLQTIKIHIPLIWLQTQLKEIFDSRINTLQQQNMYLQKQTLTNNNWYMYQITINDYELLNIMWLLNKSIEKIEQIATYEQSTAIKQKLIKYCQSKNDQSILSHIHKWTFKILKK